MCTVWLELITVNGDNLLESKFQWRFESSSQENSSLKNLSSRCSSPASHTSSRLSGVFEVLALRQAIPWNCNQVSMKSETVCNAGCWLGKTSHSRQKCEQHDLGNKNISTDSLPKILLFACWRILFQIEYFLVGKLVIFMLLLISLSQFNSIHTNLIWWAKPTPKPRPSAGVQRSNVNVG